MPKHGVLLKKHQYEQLRLIVKILIYYRDLVNQIIEKKINIQSYDWLVKFKYYLTTVEKGLELNIKVKIILFGINFLIQLKFNLIQVIRFKPSIRI